MSDDKKSEQTQDTHSKRIRFGETETSRLKAASADTQGKSAADAEQTPDTHSKRIRFGTTETSRLKTAGGDNKAGVSLPTSPKPAVKPAPGRTSVVDPMTLRDTNTSKVKRVQAAKDSSPLATVSLPGSGSPEKKTETVQLKVVQQKKKELDEEMNPASTVRLKSPSGSGPSISIPKPKTGTKPRDTMKISLPKLEKEPAAAESGGDDSSTVPVKPVAPKRADAPDQTAEPPGQTADVGSPKTVKTSTTILEKAKPEKKTSDGSADETASSVSGESAAPGSKTKAGGGRTLKIRTGAKSAKTLKVKAGDSDKTVAVQEGPQSDEAKTVKVDSPPPSSGLKLKTRETPLGESAMAGAPVVQPAKNRQNPGILYTLGAAATFVALGVTTYFLVTQAIAYVF